MSKLDWDRLPLMTAEELKALGLAPWTEYCDRKTFKIIKLTNPIWLIPYKWYNDIPDGTQLYDIFNEPETFKRGKTSDDYRGGYLAFGIKRRI